MRERKERGKKEKEGNTPFFCVLRMTLSRDLTIYIFLESERVGMKEGSGWKLHRDKLQREWERNYIENERGRKGEHEWARKEVLFPTMMLKDTGKERHLPFSLPTCFPFFSFLIYFFRFHFHFEGSLSLSFSLSFSSFLSISLSLSLSLVLAIRNRDS